MSFIYHKSVLYKIHQGHTPGDTTDTSRRGSAALTTALSRSLTRPAHMASHIRARDMAVTVPRALAGLQNLGPGAPAPHRLSKLDLPSPEASNLLQVLGTLGPQ